VLAFGGGESCSFSNSKRKPVSDSSMAY